MDMVRVFKMAITATVLFFFIFTPIVHSQQLPPPESVRLDDLGFMEGFPPPPDKVINNLNKSEYPRLRWTLQHSRELMPTRNIRRGTTPVSDLPAAPRDLDNFEFEDPEGKPITVAEWQERTYTDALVVLHRGQLVYERYYNRRASENPHVLFSITKSFTGLLAKQLIHDGKLNAEDPVTKYIPELAGSAWGDMTVRHVLDMTGGIQFREDYTDPSTEIFTYMFASGILPAPPTYTGPNTIYEFLKTLQKEGEHGEGFVYRTVHSEVLGWIVSRITGKHFADLVSEQIWQKLGMEEDAYVWLDSVGAPLQGSGLCATARDLARFGEMLRRGGEGNGHRIFDEAVIENLSKGGDREKFKASGMAFRDGYSYRSQWWILHNDDGCFEASGVHGQMLHINPEAEMVVVKLSGHPVPGSGFTHPLTLRAWDALAEAVRQ